MIISNSPDVDPDLYCYETKLSIPPCEEFLQNLLTRIHTEGDGFLIKRTKYLDPRTDRELAFTKATPLEKKMLMRRYLQSKRDFPGAVAIDFKQYFMPPEMEAELRALIPQWIKDIDDFILGVQISRGGTLNPIHKGHPRLSSLFYLLQADDEETRWYRQTKDFHVVDFFRIPDYDKIENVVCAKIMPNKWTLFNHEAWHSVHKHNQGNMDRININIDFDHISIEDLIKIVKEQESK